MLYTEAKNQNRIGSRAASTSSPTFTEPAPDLRGLKILLVEDSIDNQFLISRMLARVGLSVETANNGLEAVNKVARGSFDVVLMDIQMPEMDGYEALTKMRAGGFLRPVLALTAHALVEEKRKN